MTRLVCVTWPSDNNYLGQCSSVAHINNIFGYCQSSALTLGVKRMRIRGALRAQPQIRPQVAVSLQVGPSSPGPQSQVFSRLQQVLNPLVVHSNIQSYLLPLLLSDCLAVALFELTLTIQITDKVVCCLGLLLALTCFYRYLWALVKRLPNSSTMYKLEIMGLVQLLSYALIGVAFEMVEYHSPKFVLRTKFFLQRKFRDVSYIMLY